MTARNSGGDLASRVADKATSASTEVATQQQSPFGSVAAFVNSLAPEMAKAAPKHFSADRLARIVLTEVRRTPRLMGCTQESFGGALMTCSQLGLEPGVVGEAFLVPFRNGKTGRDEVQLQIGYQGMVKLFWQSPVAQSLDAQAVYPEDEFDYAYGLDAYLRHKPSLNRAASSQSYAYWAAMKTTTGGSAFVVLSRADVEEFRKRSKTPNAGPWMTDYDAMAKKTCIRQLFKLMPKSTELALAVANDESVRTDYRHELEAITPVHASQLQVDDVPGPDGPDEPTADEIAAALRAQDADAPPSDDPWASDGE